MGEPIIEFKNVCKEYGSKENRFCAVNDVSFTVSRGEFVVILGQSGAGKSTVLNILGGIDSPTRGTVRVNGQDITSLNEKQMTAYRAQTVGFIFQFYNLLTGLTALENVSISREIVKKPLDAEEMLAAVGLAEKKDKFPSQMSGGEQQRTAIARALAKNPEILLGDELTGALDSETGKAVLQLVCGICKKHNKTLIVVTHNALMAQCADRVIRMKNAAIVSIEENPDPVPIERVEW